jgi:thiol-disulfide isomerase/thioredoxin
MAPAAVPAETWQATNAQPIEGQLSGVFGSIAVITGTRGSGLIPLDKLDDAGLERVADYMEAPAPKAPAAWANSSGKVAKSLRHRLQVLQENNLVAFDPGTRPEPELYLVYFGAHWCPPCRAFSPKLLEAYNRLKERLPGQFEVVFVSDDHSSDEQLEYARGLGMPWPVLKYTEIGNAPAVEQWEGPGIPDLVVLTREGVPILNSYHGAEYVGPESVLDDLEPLLNAMDDASPSCRWARHRLSVLQYLRGAHGGTKGPSPYMIGIDPSRYQTLPTKKLTALLDIDERGHVTDAKADPQLPTALEFIFEQDARNWLFLPSVSNGQPKATRVKLPISF